MSLEVARYILKRAQSDFINIPPSAWDTGEYRHPDLPQLQPKPEIKVTPRPSNPPVSVKPSTTIAANAQEVASPGLRQRLMSQLKQVPDRYRGLPRWGKGLVLAGTALGTTALGYGARNLAQGLPQQQDPINYYNYPGAYPQ